MTDHNSIRLRVMAPLLIDLVAPIVVYFALHALGVGDLLALTAGGLVAGANAIVTTVRRAASTASACSSCSKSPCRSSC